MIPVRFPPPRFRIRQQGEKRYIFDGLRKTWLLLTEEEWVRQNFVAYLTQALHYPPSLIALEKELLLNGLRKRFDILVYDRAHQPWMLVECKAPAVALSEDVLQQALRYQMSVPAKFIVMTNGDATIGWEKVDGGLRLMEVLPAMAE